MQRALAAALSLAAIHLGGAAVAGAQAPSDGVECSGLPATIIGTTGNDTLSGTDARDVIAALDGDDKIVGLAGDDLICAGVGADAVDAGEGDDAVFSDSGDDRVALLGGNDYVETGAGNDTVDGGDGDDYVDSGPDHDVLRGGAGRDYLAAGAGSDALIDQSGEDYLDGGDGNDSLLGGASALFLDGGDGRDVLRSSGGYLKGASGDDTIVGQGQQVEYLDGGEGNDVLESPSGYLDGGTGADDLVGGGTGGQYLQGGDGPDSLRSGRGPSTLDGGDDNDLLVASSGADTLSGGAGDDELRGARGPDTLDGGDGSDLLVGGEDLDTFSGGTGKDRLKAADEQPDAMFDCGPTFEQDVLVADVVEDADVLRFACDQEQPPKPPHIDPIVDLFFNVAAHGDSFSSGEGTYDYDFLTELDGGCHRGPKAWPRLLASSHSDAWHSFEHNACSGARLDALLAPFKGEERQLPTKPDADMDLVMFTMGGNDAEFAAFVAACRNPANKDGCASQYWRKRMRVNFDLLTAILPRRYKTLRRTYPNARILHVGYPRLTPKPDEALHGCTDAKRRWLRGAEQSYASQIAYGLNNTILWATQDSPHEIEFVPVADVLDGHELCSEDPWVNEINITSDDVFSDGGPTERAHPTVRGQQAYADAVEDYLAAGD